ncbi:Aste57867_21980 [Aphanomyces stellatus]|uniref:Aste57867_21980 protein n=1 Tax=Aphanomyces stellatus TaxID=120398 RepID=A0A485LKB4_9STRA|nr:hypothetical protein As57867_021911 [Aphanomyces stellatus]VFT98648.1 Aste57867_21980 [Aphanomyces stellatus]
MSTTVRSVCLVPSGLLNFEGKIMPNAYAFADMDGDSQRELIVGAMSGKLAIFKGLSSPDSAYNYTVDGCITSIVTYNMVVETPEDEGAKTRKCVILVMTAEGTCYIFHREGGGDSGASYAVHSHFSIPLNVSTSEILGVKLVVGTRDTAIHVFDVEHLDRIKKINQFVVPGEVEAFLRSHEAPTTTLLVCLQSGEVLEMTIDDDAAPSSSFDVLEHGEDLTCGRSYILSGVKAKGIQSCDAYGYFNGHVKLKDRDTGSVRWSIQLPDALLKMATINLFQDGDEEVILCCWNGDVYIVNTVGSQLKFTIPFSITAFFSGSLSVVQNGGSEDVLFCATTSGGILFYVGIGQSIRHIRHDSVVRPPHMDVITHSALYDAIDTPAKRRDVLLALRKHLPRMQIENGDAPTLQECIRACVYAPNAIMDPPPPAVVDTDNDTAPANDMDSASTSNGVEEIVEVHATVVNVVVAAEEDEGNAEFHVKDDVMTRT